MAEAPDATVSGVRPAAPQTGDERPTLGGRTPGPDASASATKRPRVELPPARPAPPAPPVAAQPTASHGATTTSRRVERPPFRTPPPKPPPSPNRSGTERPPGR